MRRKLLICVCFLLVSSLACRFLSQTQTPVASPSPSPTPSATPTPPGTPTPVQTSAMPQPHEPVERDVTYCVMEGVPLFADIYFAQNNPGPAPLLIFVHGGTWMEGSKSGGMGFDGIPALTHAGYTLASIDYRLAPQYKMPAMIQDVKCAVRSFRAHAAEYGIDPERIGVIGASAGGHLAAMLGTTDESAGFDVGEYAGYPSGVQAVVDMAGPVDLRTPFTSDSEQVAESVFGTSDPNNPMLVAASPLTWISPGDAPFLIIHGANDQRVPLWQSQALYDSLNAAGVPARFIIVKNAGHTIDNPDQSPTRQELVGFILVFFEEYLR